MEPSMSSRQEEKILREDTLAKIAKPEKKMGF
jgi:hypothetical protein